MPVVLVAAFLHLSIIALAAAPATGLGLNAKHRAPLVPHTPSGVGPTMSLSPGSQLCPASGLGATCDTSVSAAASPGQSSLPDGLTQCPADPAKSELRSPAACDNTKLSSPASPAAGPTTPMAFGSYLWSFEPSLLGSYTKATAPGWSPNQVGCAGNMAAWQYELSAGSTSDVDSDEALSNLPLWYP